jgi:hypothetical protein
LTKGGGFAIVSYSLSLSAKSLDMIFPKPPFRITKMIGLALILALLHPGSSSADVIITEFMASNNSVIDDEDGESSDWIEIYNTGPALVNLDGFYLTDDPADLTKWRIPNVTIAVEDFVIVFASAKDRDDPESELHTNFRLSARGDYIALIDRDGTSVLSEFGPDFPEQFEDVSYGLEQTGNTTNITFLQSGADCRRVVPTRSLGLAWTAKGFDDASWPTATTGIGYENSSGYETLFGTNGDVGAQMSGINTSAYIRIPFDVADPTGLIGLTLDMKYDDGFIAYLNGVRIASSNGPQSADWNTGASGSNDDSAALLFESFDIIAHAGSLQTGSNLLAVHGLNVSTTSSDFLIVPQIRAVRISDPSVGGPGYLDSATPGSFNGSTFSGFVLDTVFSVDRGFYDDPFQVEITTSTPGATIRWTTDGSDPTASRGTVYTGPIAISQTTVLRAAAFKTDLVPTNIDTQTYLFLDDVIKQSPNGQVPSGWPRSGVNGQELNYGMDPEIVGSRHSEQEVIDSLKAIPTISMVTPLANLFNGQTGIYVNAGGSGRSWERPASFELLNPDASPGFQIDGGVRVRGGFSRSDGNPKHAFRLFFRREYGEGKLRFPLFEDEGTDEFDNIDLRTSQNYSWSFQNDSRNNFLRDVWSRDIQREMGQPSTRSRFYHLYINGVYWGLFQTQERAEASFAEAYFGGDKEDYDVITKYGGTTDGNRDAFNRLYDAGQAGFASNANYYKAQGLNPDRTPNPAFERLLDVDNVIDYMIITYYSGDRDGPGSRYTGPNPNNFFSIYNRKNPDGFKTFEHDSEHSLGTGDNNMISPFTRSTTRAHFNPHTLHEQLTANADYLQRFNDRVQKHLFNGGALDATVAAARLDARAKEIETAIIAESARWGDSKRSRPFTDADWRGARDSTRNWILNRTPTLVSQLRAQRWYPDVDAPTFTPPGGSISSAESVFFKGSQGQIWFTSDGEDPRAPGGSVAPSASRAQPSGTVSTVFVDEGVGVSVFVPGDDSLGDTWRDAEFDDTQWLFGQTGVGYDENTEYDNHIDLDVDGLMNNENTSIYLRVPFEIADLAGLSGLVLKMKYDDGFVAYINGSRVASDNAPGALEWDSASTNLHDDDLAVTFVSFPIDEHLNKLQVGDNLLTIHGLNDNLGSSDMLVSPRLEGTRISGGTPVTLPPGIVRLQTRSLDGGEWSALSETTFLVDVEAASADKLVISKVMFNPSVPTAAEEAAGFDRRGDFEYFEVLNIGPMTIHLGGVRLVAGIEFTFPFGTVLDPGERLLVVSNLAAFEMRYGAGLPVAGEFENNSNLDDGGERIHLLDENGQTIAEFTFDDDESMGWPSGPDGDGYALVLLDPESANDPALAGSWRASGYPGGQPGTNDRLTFASWKADYFDAVQLGNSVVSGNLADPDFDGLTNFVEFILASDPLVANSHNAVQGRVIEAGGEDHFAITFRRWVGAEELATSIQSSFDGNVWTTAKVVRDSISLNGDGTQTEVWRSTDPITAKRVELLRVLGSIPQ